MMRELSRNAKGVFHTITNETLLILGAFLRPSSTKNGGNLQIELSSS